jgi:hypothetical protein
MGFHLRKRIKLGPAYVWLDLSKGWPRFTSWGLTAGRYTRNMTRGQTTVDTPGPGYYRSKASRPTRRRRAS